MGTIIGLSSLYLFNSALIHTSQAKIAYAPVYGAQRFGSVGHTNKKDK